MRRGICASLTLILFCTLPLHYGPSVSASSIDTKELVRLINRYRESQGVEPLERNRRLEQSSANKAKEMVSARYFGHSGPAGNPFYVNIRKAGYKYSRVGEILARGCESEKCLFDLWVESREHRQIILDPVFQEIGCSDRAANATDRYFAVCHFGRPGE